MSQPFPLEDINLNFELPAEGRFLVPLCVTREELILMWTTLFNGARNEQGIYDPTVYFPLLQAVQYINSPEKSPCYRDGGNCEDGVCVEYSLRAPFIDWIPHSPYLPEAQREEEHFWRIIDVNLPDGWLADALEQFIEATGIDDVLTELAFGLRNGDVLTTLADSLKVLFKFGVLRVGDPLFPGFRLNVVGSGTVELHLLEVPFGGKVFVALDDDPWENINDLGNILTIADSFLDPNDAVHDLRRDFSSIPPEVGGGEVVIEVEIDSPGEHYISVRFVPNFDTEFIPVAFGGGIRKIVLCGFEEWEDIPTEGRIDMSCGCDDLRSIYNDMLLGAAYGLYNQAIPPGSTIGNPGSGNDGDGNNGRINPGSSGSVNPIDIPDFPAAADLAGAAYFTSARFREATSDLYARIQTNGFTPAEALEYAQGVYDVDSSAAAIWLDLVAQGQQLAIIPDPPQAEALYCDAGAPSRVPSALIAQSYESFGTPAASLPYRQQVAVFSQQQWAAWWDEGLSRPRTDFQGFACALRQTIDVQIDMSLAAANFPNYNSRVIVSATSWSARSFQTLLYLTLSGTWVDSAGDLHDALYRFASDGSSAVYEPVGMRFEGVPGVASHNINIPTAQRPVPASNHVYRLTHILPGNTGGPFSYWPSASAADLLTGAVGALDIEIADAGRA